MLSVLDQEPTHERPGVFRWLIVGVACYVSWLVFNLALAAVFPFLYLIDAIGKKAGRDGVRRFFIWSLRIFFIHYLSFLGVYRFAELPDPKRLDSLGSCVLVANHRSWLDALLILALVPKAVIPVNTSYTRVPLVGRAMIRLGCVPLDRGSPESVVAGFAKVRNALQGGAVVAGFPEGTRALNNELRPFSAAFFHLAIELGAPVIPMLLHSDLPYLSPQKGTLLTPWRANWTIRMLEETHAKSGERSVDFSHRVRKTMSLELERIEKAGSNDPEAV